MADGWRAVDRRQRPPMCVALPLSVPISSCCRLLLRYRSSPDDVAETGISGDVNRVGGGRGTRPRRVFEIQRNWLIAEPVACAIRGACRKRSAETDRRRAWRRTTCGNEEESARTKEASELSCIHLLVFPRP
jgi:hypothetical protein